MAYSIDDDDGLYDFEYVNEWSNLSYSEYNWNISNSTNDTDYESSSDWCDAGDHEKTIKVFQTCVFCLIFLLGVVGNCLVIATFILYRRLRLRSMTDVFLFHLAMADLLLLLTLPLQAVDTLGWIFSTPLCKALRACYAINTYSGLLLLACISVDRYLVMVRAQEMLRLRSQILTCGMVTTVLVWLVAVLLSLPEILFAGVLPGDEAYCGMLKNGSVKKITNRAIITVFCLSLLVMTMCYSLIAQVLRERGAHQQWGRQWHRQRTLKLMVALVFVFLLFQLPYTVVLSRKMAGEFCGLLLEYVTCTLAYMRCCLNPILYAMVGVRFRNDVTKLLLDFGCLCRHQMGLQTRSTTSVSLSSPAPVILSTCSPTLPDQISSSNETVPPTAFKLPVTK